MKLLHLPQSFAVAVAGILALLPGMNASGGTPNADICEMRENITANPALLSTALAEVEKSIDAVADPKIKGPLLVHCAAGLALTNVPAALPHVIRLAREGLKHPLETEDTVQAFTLIGNAMADQNANALPANTAARQQIAESYLKALKIILDKAGTLVVEPMPTPIMFTGEAPWAARNAKGQEQKREEILLHNRLATIGTELRKRLLSLYPASSANQGELRRNAGSILANRDHVQCLLDYHEKQTPRSLLPSPPPALSSESF